MNGKDSKGITLRNGWGRDWSGGSVDLVVDLVGERGEEEPLAASFLQAKQRERKPWVGLGAARAPHICGCVAPFLAAP
jgi:hypothetical protein